MESLIEPLRYTTSLLSLVTAAAFLRELKPRGGQLHFLLAWLALAVPAAWYTTHLIRGLPTPMLLPLLATLGVGLGAASLFSAQARQLFDRLDGTQWRLLMGQRAIFGALLLAGGAAGIMPVSFTLSAGLGDLLTGALALAVPGSLAANGPRGVRLFIYAFGIVDFISVVVMMVKVVVPWVAETNGLGISLMLPWVAVPLLAAVNLHGLRSVLAELLVRAPRAEVSAST